MILFLQPEPMPGLDKKGQTFCKPFPWLSPITVITSGAGGSADDLSVLDEMLRQGFSSIIAGPIWDRHWRFDQMIAGGEGNEITLTIGGNTSVPSIGQVGHGISCTGMVKKITDGRFTITGPMHTGLEVCLGRTAVIRYWRGTDTYFAKNVGEPYDPWLSSSMPVSNPGDCKYILIKSRQHFRAGFESLASHIMSGRRSRCLQFRL